MPDVPGQNVQRNTKLLITKFFRESVFSSVNNKSFFGNALLTIFKDNSEALKDYKNDELKIMIVSSLCPNL